MKNILNLQKMQLLFAVLLATTTLSAQFYGKHRYGTSSRFCTGSRISSPSLGVTTPWGYTLGGYWATSAPGTANFDLYLTDSLGFFGVGTFSCTYRVMDAPNCSNFGQQNNCSGITVVGATNTGGGEVFAVTGVYNRGCFFSTLSQNGTPISNYRWIFPNYNGSVSKPLIKQSVNTPGEYFICGEFDGHIYVNKIDNSGSVIFENWYSNGLFHLFPRAIIESPFGSNELVIVGRYSEISSSSTEPFFMRVNASTGALIALEVYGGNAYFTSIQPAFCTNGGSNGYIIGGWNDAVSGSYPQWMLKVDQSGGVI
jgi:hypothetical protein